MKFILGCLIAFVAVVPMFGQVKPLEPLKWQPVIGHEKELAIFMPARFKVLVDNTTKNFAGPGQRPVTVKKTVRVARLFNGTLLLMIYYETNARSYFETLSATNGLTFESENKVGAFTVKRFAGKVKEYFKTTHYFFNDNRLYEATAFSRSKNDPIAEAFFTSTRIADGPTYLGANAKEGETSTSLPRLFEKEPERMPDDVKLEDSAADRGAVILYQPAFRSWSDQGSMPRAGNIKATALLSASGTVTDVKTMGSAPLDMQQAFAEAVKKTIFVPAEKDGKLVSVFRVFSWEMIIEVRGGGPIRVQ